MILFSAKLRKVLKKGRGRIFLMLVRPSSTDESSPSMFSSIASATELLVTLLQLSRDKTKELVSRSCYWPGMSTDIESYISNCHSCQVMKSTTQAAAGLLQPLPIPEGPWQSISHNFIPGLPKTKGGFNSVLVVVDQSSYQDGPLCGHKEKAKYCGLISLVPD